MSTQGKKRETRYYKVDLSGDITNPTPILKKNTARIGFGVSSRGVEFNLTSGASRLVDATFYSNCRDATFTTFKNYEWFCGCQDPNTVKDSIGGWNEVGGGFIYVREVLEYDA